MFLYSFCYRMLIPDGIWWKQNVLRTSSIHTRMHKKSSRRSLFIHFQILIFGCGRIFCSAVRTVFHFILWLWSIAGWIVGCIAGCIIGCVVGCIIFAAGAVIRVAWIICVLGCWILCHKNVLLIIMMIIYYTFYCADSFTKYAWKAIANFWKLQ